MLIVLERVRVAKSGMKRNQRSRSTSEGRQKRAKGAWVEIHIRATDWFAHQHHTDMRYNNVVLHIVLVCDSSRPTMRQDGTVIPTCSLNDVLPATRNHRSMEWPCHYIIAHLHEAQRSHLFTMAGMLRFEMKAQVFFALLSSAAFLNGDII
jgi:hypothetical protein